MAEPRRAVAPAKLNLYLEIVGRRADGYHDLSTLFQTVDWGDTVVLDRSPLPVFDCDAEGLEIPGAPDDNLALRAVKAYFAAGALFGGASVHIEKRIPIGAGLGGGSSDAATVLRLLEDETRAVGEARLLTVAAKLGADVPFLLKGGTAVGSGRGDEIRPLAAAPPVEFVLIMPPFATETAKVYARAAERLRRAPKGGLEHAIAALASGVPSRIREAHHNDLAEAALRAVPELLWFTSKVERLLGRAPCMTGSGSTLFDVPEPGEAADVVARLVSLEGRREIVHTPAGA